MQGIRTGGQGVKINDEDIKKTELNKHSTQSFFSLTLVGVRKIGLGVSLAGFALSGCETMANLTEKATSMIPVSYEEYASALIGNTMIDVDDSYAVYFREDGAKIGYSSATNGATVTRSWRREDNGGICETRLVNDQEVCMSGYKPKITQDAGVYTMKFNQNILQFRIVSGNARDL